MEESKPKCNIKLKKSDSENNNKKRKTLNIFENVRCDNSERKDNKEEEDVSLVRKAHKIRSIRNGEIITEPSNEFEKYIDQASSRFIHNLQNKINRIQNKNIVYLNFPQKWRAKERTQPAKNQHDLEITHISKTISNVEDKIAAGVSEKDAIGIEGSASNESLTCLMDRQKSKERKRGEVGEVEKVEEADVEKSNGETDDEAELVADFYKNPKKSEDMHKYNITEGNLTYKRKMFLDKFRKIEKESIFRKEMNMYTDFDEHNIEIEDYGKKILSKMGYNEDIYNKYINEYYKECSDKNYFDKIYENFHSRDFRFTGVGAEEEMKENLQRIREHEAEDARSRSGLRSESRRGDRSGLRSESRCGDRSGLRSESRCGDRNGLRSESRCGDRSGLRSESRCGDRSGLRSESRCGDRSGLRSESRCGDRSGLRSESRSDRMGGRERVKIGSKDDNREHEDGVRGRRKDKERRCDEMRYRDHSPKEISNYEKYDNMFEGLIVKINLKVHEFYRRKGIIIYKKKRRKNKNSWCTILGLLIFKNYKYINIYKQMVKKKIKDFLSWKMKRKMTQRKESDESEANDQSEECSESEECNQSDEHACRGENIQNCKNFWKRFLKELIKTVKRDNSDNHGMIKGEKKEPFCIIEIKSKYVETTLSDETSKCKVVHRNIYNSKKNTSLYKQTVKLKKLKQKYAYVQIEDNHILKVSLDDICQYI
ncbi:hypothetical protein, conserved [Plasmodium gonderi]|uniref:Uncharacterized protein n=1 Tax=Plasmodium gonderi TaxID=77519 RepID=A0A1Y1JJT2_PLAGO|nr:hypothetical protein, conserved [Plasmodium gonderi]GAW80304.1 hypothetical protein, conserved [Plasmodium gonderi]